MALRQKHGQRDQAAEEGDEDECFVYIGTQLLDEVETHGGQHSKDVRDASAQRSLPIWKQEVTDEQGRRRFHGAFEGGFSAGYFNSVGSVEGFQPAAFRSSRGERAAAPAPQSIDAFLDTDELEERQKSSVHVQDGYDTFGLGVVERARLGAQREAEQRPSLIPGPILDDLVVPIADSIGMRLLKLMGWRPGRGVGSATASAPVVGSSGSAGASSKWGTAAGVSLDNTPIHVLEPKQNVHGLGFDPFLDAEEFRNARQKRDGGGARPGGPGGPAGGRPDGQLRPKDVVAPGKRVRGIAFGSGVLDDDDTMTYLEDYADQGVGDDDDDDPPQHRLGSAALRGGGGGGRPAAITSGGGGGAGGGRAGPKTLALTGRGGYSFELASDEEDDEDRFSAKRKKPGPLLLTAGGAAAQLLLQSKGQLRPGGSFVAGFIRAEQQVAPLAGAAPPPPVVPDSFVERHVFAAPLPPLGATQSAGITAVQLADVAPPEDAALRREIDSLAAQVARSGGAVEALARRRAGQPGGKFGFLLGGPGAEYYTWRLHKIKAAFAAFASRLPAASDPPRPAATGQVAMLSPRPTLTIEQRMALLGEMPLATSAVAAATTAALERAQELAGPGRSGTGVAGPSNPFQVAEGDKRRLQSALASSFVTSTTQDMSMEGQQYGLRPGANVKLSPAAAAAAAAFASRFATGSTTETAVLPPEAAAGLHRAPVVASPAVAAAAAAAAQDAKRPVRSSEDWRPEPLLCRRLNVPDPYAGKPQAQQMSKFKLDYVALPDTNAAIVAAAQAAAASLAALLPPPPPLPMLPPPPPLPSHLQQALPPPPPMPTDAKTLAANFLASLDTDLPGAGAGGTSASAATASGRPAGLPSATPPVASQAGGLDDEDMAAGGTMLDKPMDLFKAIFEASDDEDDEEDEASVPQRPPPLALRGPQPQPPSAAAAEQQVGEAALAGGPPPPAMASAPASTAASRAQERARGLADALMRAQEVSAVGAQEARARTAAAAAAAAERQRDSAGAGPSKRGGGDGYAASVGAAGGTPAAGPDAATQQRIREALGMLRHGASGGSGKAKKDKKKHKKHRKGHKERDKERDRGDGRSKQSKKHKRRGANDERPSKRRRKEAADTAAAAAPEMPARLPQAPSGSDRSGSSASGGESSSGSSGAE